MRIFFAHDLKFFLLIALVLKFFNKDIYTIEHNTIPDKFSKKLIHYFLSFFVNKIVFTDYIKSIYPNNKYNITNASGLVQVSGLVKTK